MPGVKGLLGPCSSQHSVTGCSLTADELGRMGLGPALARGPRVSLGRVLLLLQGTTGTRALALPSQLEKKLDPRTMDAGQLSGRVGPACPYLPSASSTARIKNLRRAKSQPPQSLLEAKKEKVGKLKQAPGSGQGNKL